VEPAPHAPQPAVVADFAVSRKLSSVRTQRQVVLIRLTACRTKPGWIAVADGQVAQNLVVGPVFLEDKDHVLDALGTAAITLVVVALGVGEPVVRDHRCVSVPSCPGWVRKVWRPPWSTGVVRIREKQVLSRPVAAIAPVGLAPVGDFPLIAYTVPPSPLKLTSWGKPVGMRPTHRSLP